MYLNTIMLLQYCWCHSGCSCLNGYNIVMFLGCWVIYFVYLFVSFTPKKVFFCFLFRLNRSFLFLFHINVKCMSIFWKSWSTPMSITDHTLSSSPFLFCNRLLRPTECSEHRECVCACVRARGCMYVRFRTCLLRGSDNSHFKTRALVWNLAQFVKNVKEKKKNTQKKQEQTFKAHRLVSTFPTFALYWLFSMTYFFLLWPF